MVETSENKEAIIVLAHSLTLAAATYISTLPVPDDVKLPTVAFLGTVSAAILAFWKTKVNPQK